MGTKITPTLREIFFDNDTFIVSKTDLKGRITYANSVFCKVAGYTEMELVGQPHSIIRHPDMPRAVFKLLWDTLAQKKEVFAYVKNMAKSGDFYWVFAHVTPSFSRDGQIIGYHSNRRVPKRSAIDALTPLYAELLRIESSHRNAKEGLAASYKAMIDKVLSMKSSYDELVFSL